MSRNRIDDVTHYQRFAADLQFAVEQYPGLGEESLIQQQRRQLRKLIELETQFRQALVAHSSGPAVYEDFMTYIRDIRRSILVARPYFRERQVFFTKYIAKAFKTRSAKALYRFRINWMFIAWVLKSRKWAPGSKIVKISREINKIRKEISELNYPLAISQARQFWDATPKSHLTYMDIVQVHCMGLLLAIDKFVPPNDKRLSEKKSLEAYRKFRAVAIGIMTRDRVNQYSETLIHFFPKYKMLKYRANKLARKLASGELTLEKLTELVNAGLEKEDTIDIHELAKLMAAGSCISADQQSLDGSVGEDVTPMVFQFPCEAPLVSEIFEEKEAMSEMRVAISRLDKIEQKVLKLKGVT